jgi:proliferating cell nuclear antigen
VLANTLETISVIVDECKIHLTESGLEIRAVDPANVAMADIELGAGAFESYEASGGVIGVDLTRFEDIIGMADSGQLVQLTLDQETRKLHISLDGLEYTLALIDPDTIRQEPDIPELDLTASLSLEGRDLDRAITAADMISDHIEFGVDADDEIFYARAEGDTDDVTVELDRDDLLSFSPGEAQSLFSIDYMNDLKKSIGSDAEISIRLGEEFPMKMEMQFAEGDGNALWMVAPRIQSGD